VAVAAQRDGTEGSAGVTVLDSVHGQVATLMLDGRSSSEPFVYESATPVLLTLQLFNWGPTPFDLTVAPATVEVKSDQVNSACTL
jgi:hypothetical protein